MPYEDEDPHLNEPDPALTELTHRVIGAAIEVHRHLEAGLDEASYEAAMAKEMLTQGIPFQRQVVVPVMYKGEVVGEKRLDFLIDGCIVLELKAVEELTKLHKAQVKTYLKITGCQIGLLINFNVVLLKEGIKRIIYRR